MATALRTPIEEHLCAYADKIIGALGRELGMSAVRRREYLHRCLERWETTYGQEVAKAVRSHIKDSWEQAKRARASST